ncbi:uncharacterized protein LOC133526891 [Cydia pomonella]|uniref:uncharacterized protein LOC133526891 n=1 Tax=Cydia pomonella TaxID=82600 RepID=UPI002ADD528F|nr:uncharacterized protein LOC133526891 [Cydia pomonella]
MAANIMEMLKQIQRDLAHQKEYIRNLNLAKKNLKEKYNIIEGKITDLDMKIEQQNIGQQQVLETMKRLEQEIKKNNRALFGSVGTEINIEDKTSMSYMSDLGDMEKSAILGQESKESKEYDEVPELEISSESVLMEKTLNNEGKKANNNNVQRMENKSDQIGKYIGDKIKEIKQLLQDFISITNYTQHEQNAESAQIYNTFINADQMSQLNDKLNIITDLYKSDMKYLRESIKNIEVIIKMFTEETKNSINQLSSHFSFRQIDQLNNVMKPNTDMNLSEFRQIKKILQDIVATNKMPTKESASTVYEEGPDNLSPTCFVSELICETGEIKKLIKDFESKITNEDAKNIVIKEKADKIYCICNELKQTTTTNQLEIKEIKELMALITSLISSKDDAYRRNCKCN